MRVTFVDVALDETPSASFHPPPTSLLESTETFARISDDGELVGHFDDLAAGVVVTIEPIRNFVADLRDANQIMSRAGVRFKSRNVKSTKELGSQFSELFNLLEGLVVPFPPGFDAVVINLLPVMGDFLESTSSGERNFFGKCDEIISLEQCVEHGVSQFGLR